MEQSNLILKPYTHTGARARMMGNSTEFPTFSDTQKKIDRAIKFLRSWAAQHNIALAYSGGKDSDVILRLAQLSGIKFQAYHNCTTIDPPGTLSYVQSKGVIINRPKYTFFQLVQKKGLPSMWRRFCCQYLKEEYIAPYLILGIRAGESVKRSKRYKEPTACKLYTKKKTTEQILPIVSWSDNDICNFAKMESLTFHPAYYNNGHFDVTRRLGCIGCPLQGDRGKADFLNFPKFLRQLIRAYLIYCNEHQRYGNPYLDIVEQLFYSNHGREKMEQTYKGLFPAPNPKEYLENYFNITL